jgi:hypothetical protein
MKLSILFLSAIAIIAIANPVAEPQKEPADPCDKCDKKFLACKKVRIPSTQPTIYHRYTDLTVPLVMGLLAQPAPVRPHVRMPDSEI